MMRVTSTSPEEPAYQARAYDIALATPVTGKNVRNESWALG